MICGMFWRFVLWRVGAENSTQGRGGREFSAKAQKGAKEGARRFCLGSSVVWGMFAAILALHLQGKRDGGGMFGL